MWRNLISAQIDFYQLSCCFEIIAVNLSFRFRHATSPQSLTKEKSASDDILESPPDVVVLVSCKSYEVENLISSLLQGTCWTCICNHTNNCNAFQVLPGDDRQIELFPYVVMTLVMVVCFIIFLLFLWHCHLVKRGPSVVNFPQQMPKPNIT